MFNSGKKYSNSRVIRKQILNETKNQPGPPFKLNGRSLINHCLSFFFVTASDYPFGIFNLLLDLWQMT